MIMSKATEKVIGGPMRRLVRCVGCLGMRHGFLYWKLQNKAMRQPELVPIWCEAWLAGAEEAEKAGDHLTAGVLRAFTKDVRQRLADFNQANAKDDESPPK